MEMSNAIKGQVSREFQAIINKLSLENFSNTPDWILAEYLVGCLANFDATMELRERWYGREVFQQKKVENATE